MAKAKKTKPKSAAKKDDEKKQKIKTGKKTSVEQNSTPVPGGDKDKNTVVNESITENAKNDHPKDDGDVKNEKSKKFKKKVCVH